MGKKVIAYVNKEMLIWARKQTIFETPEDVEARFPNLKAEKIKKWENGEDNPSVTEAKELAAKYKLPFACFFMPKCPEKTPKKKYVDRRTIWGAEYSSMSYELWSEIERIRNDRDLLIKYKGEDIEEYNLPEMTGNETIKEVALEVKGFLGIPLSFKTKSCYHGNPFNYFRLKLEGKGIIVAQVTGVELTEMKGISIYDDLYPIVAVNNRDYEKSKVFSLFHEVAHLIRRSSSLCLIDDEERDDDEEKICDALAAEILMPTDEFKKIANEIIAKNNNLEMYVLQKIADRFGVSTVAVFRRLFNVGIIDEDYFYIRLNEIKTDFQKVVELVQKKLKENNAPVYQHIKFINNHGHLMPQAVLEAHQKGDISFGEMCKVLNMKSCYISDLTKAVMV